MGQLLRAEGHPNLTQGGGVVFSQEEGKEYANAFQTAGLGMERNMKIRNARLVFFRCFWLAAPKLASRKQPFSLHLTSQSFCGKASPRAFVQTALPFLRAGSEKETPLPRHSVGHHRPLIPVGLTTDKRSPACE